MLNTVNIKIINLYIVNLLGIAKKKPIIKTGF
jgi:hypothetical protein